MEREKRSRGPRVEQEFGRKLTEDDVVRMRSMDDPTIIPDIYKLARIAAEIQVKPEHWVGELPRWCDGTHPSAKTRPRLPPTAPPAPPSALDKALSRLRAKLARTSSPGR